MKILAIRGKNLASLSNEFCVDFESEPLASAGLYAITGVTGSGKSTLLDALCLALYERTPRLTRAAAQGESIPDVGDNSVGPADPRTILRRGAADAFAEVDFVGSDGLAYRARWSVRRARNKAEGKLQNSEVTLTRLRDMQLLGDHRKSESLRLIEACIGLSFAQFTRAVLLAQNDFATFLKASDDERAELLQTLTGTETFMRISMQAFDRQRSENEALRLLSAQLADQVPMAAEARTAKASELAAHDARVKTLEQQKTLIEAHLRWHEQAEKLKASEADAGVNLERAKLVRAQAGERYAQFARVDAVQSARPLCADVTRLAGEINSGAQALKAQEVLLAQAAHRVADGKEALAVALRALQAAEDAKTSAQTGVDQAKALDAQITALTPNHQRAVNSRDDAKRLYDQAVARHATLQKDLAQAQASVRLGQGWLAANAPLRPLAEGWQRWQTLFGHAAALLEDSQSSAAQCKELAGQERVLKAALDQALAAHLARAAEDQAASEQLAALSKAFAAFKPEEIARQKQGVEARREQLTSAAQLDKDLAEQQQRRRQLHVQKQACTNALEVCEKEIAQCATEAPLAERDFANAEKMFRIAGLAASENVEQLRAGLEADCPCPVCGASAHPYAEHNPQLEGVLQSLQDEVARLRKRATEVVQRASAAAAHRQSTLKQVGVLDEEVATLTRALSRSEQLWADHPLADELRPVAAAECPPSIAEKQLAVGATLAELARQESACSEAMRARDFAQDVASKAQAAMAAAKDALARSELDHQKVVLAGEAARAKLSATGQQLALAQAGLDAAFADASQDWRQRWSADAAGFVAECEAKVQAWTTQQGKVTALAEKVGTLGAAIDGALAAVESAGRHLKTQSEQFESVGLDLHKRQAERKSLFAGTPVAEVEAALASAIETAKAGLAQRGANSQQADVDNSRLDEALRQTARRVEALRTALAGARQALNEWLERFNAGQGDTALSSAALGELLAFPPDWIADERRSLHALESAIASALAVLGEHQKAQAAHLAGKPTDAAAEALRAALAQALADLEPANAQAAGLRVELARDDERRQKSQSLLAERDRQAAKARVWSQLSELIGSADGKKFRNFAQQLTLDILLGYANRHLETLSRRYRLERIEGSLGLLVVDQEMGDEVRSVHSLSGGESFLVSLALALGLASLSSHRVQVESLFIDEGFGSLDADALAVALDALDSLQAQGRKVGVISHVPEMNERIGTRIEVRRLAGGHSRVVVA